MRAVVRSKTYQAQLKLLLEIGAEKFGVSLVEEKLTHLDHTIDSHLAHFPGVKRRDERLGLVVYPVSGTPFIVLYDFDATELRLHFVLSTGAGDRLDELDPSSAEW